MEHVCTDMIFLFWDGKTQYSVNYYPSLRAWFVFEGEKDTEALAKYDLPKNAASSANEGTAKNCLDEFLNPGSTHFQNYKCTRYDYSKQKS